MPHIQVHSEPRNADYELRSQKTSNILQRPQAAQASSGGPSKTNSRPKSAAPRLNFANRNDNTSKAAFRKGKTHNATFTLSKTCEKIEPDRGRMYSRLEEIGIRFGSFIRPPQFLYDRVLLLWGDEKQVADTVAELKNWVSLSDDNAQGRSLRIA